MERISSRSWFAVAAVFALTASAAFAQQLATLKVTVTDSTGAVIPGATVTVRNTATDAKRTDVTESHGLSVIQQHAELTPSNLLHNPYKVR